ncbi:MAG TPA: SOS response-associated peptidase [Myxococcaceae bacterium]|nr:SOS response-associated peptidase [Myxococcaceae bacterium]
MCGRITVRTSASDLQRAFELTSIEGVELRPRFNLAPTQPVPVVTNSGERKLELYRWGLVPAWAKDVKIGNNLINARSDTVAEKPSFRSAFKKRRCLMLVDGFYEWRTDADGKTPFHIHRKDGQPFAVAALWEEWKTPEGQPLRTCAIITTGPNAVMTPIHDRMPVILSKQGQALWLQPGEVKAEELMPLLVPYQPDELQAFEVSRVVNSTRNDRPECIVPVQVPSPQLVQRVLL